MATSWLWAGFGFLIFAILAFDLMVLGRSRTMRTRRALLIAAAYISIAIAFGGALYAVVGRDAAMEYYTAYLLEESLSLDNLFLWVLVFEQMGVPEHSQQKVLFWGIIGAMLFRAAFIFAGSALIGAFDWLLYGFAALVIFTGAKLLRDAGRGYRVSDSRLLELLRRRLPIAEGYAGRRFLVRHGGTLCATPLLVALIVIETTDLVFAMDSLPAIFGVTRDPMIIYTSNIFAVVGLRALFFAVSGLMERLVYLRYGLALLLVLIGLKMIADRFVHIPAWAALGATLLIVGGTAAASLLRGRRAEA